MAARAVGTVTISFGLVSIPVKLYTTASSESSISFNMLHKKCNGRLKQQYICPRDENAVVPREETVRGYEFAKDQYVIFSDEELKELQEKATQEVQITEFVPREKVPTVYYDKAYYLGPDKGGDRAYKLLSEAMRQTGRSAIAKYAARGKQYLVLVSPLEEGLVMHQLYYADEVRPFSEVPLGDADVKEGELRLAVQLVEQIASDSFNPDKYEDEVRKRVEEAIQRKVEGHELTQSTAETPKAQIIDLMEALKASLSERVSETIGDEVGRNAGPASEAGAKRKPPKPSTSTVSPRKTRSKATEK